MSFNEVISLLHTARKMGVDILVNDSGLQLKISKGVPVDPQLLKTVKDNKELIIDVLSSGRWRDLKADMSEKIYISAVHDKPGRVPLSFNQERLWFIDRKEGSIPYHIPAIIRLRGKLNVPALEQALRSIVNRHEVLRTVIKEEDGTPYQEVLNTDGWQLIVNENDIYREEGGRLSSHVRQLVSYPFDLAVDHKLRAALIKIGEEEYLLTVVMHHIAADGWSTAIIIRELREFYRAYTEGRVPGLGKLPIQYSDYAIWQRKYLEGEVMDRKISYWRKQLDGVTPLNLPVDYEGIATRHLEGGSEMREIDREITEKLLSLSYQEGMTLFMVLLGAFKILLYRYSDQDDICIGSSIAGRMQEEISGLIGFFSNTLAFRSKVCASRSVREFLLEVKKTVLDGFENQEAPFEKVVEALGVKREKGNNPVFQVMFVLENAQEGGKLDLGDLSIRGEDFGVATPKFDFTLSIQHFQESLHLNITYRSDLYRQSTVQRLLTHYENILSAIVFDKNAAIGNLNMLTGAEEKDLLDRYAAGGTEGPLSGIGKTVTGLFEEQVARTPEAVAVVCEEIVLTYSQLDERADQLGSYLMSLGVKKETLVPVCMDRSVDMIIGLLGIMKAGGAYVPVDTQYPDERIRYVLADAGSPIILAGTGQRQRMKAIIDGDENLCNTVVVDIAEDWPAIEKKGRARIAKAAGPENLVYVIYTSGSTGRPKGVMIEHRSVVDYLYGLQERTGIQECKSFALVSTLSADLGNTVIYSALVSGGALHIISSPVANDGHKLLDYFKRHRIECLKIVPSHWQALNVGDDALLPERMLIFGGEALPMEVIERIRSRHSHCKIINHYGPTETTIGKLVHLVEQERVYTGGVPIGKPFSHTKVYILDPSLNVCPVGVEGEICIGGEGLSRGYLNAPELTAEKFIRNPFGKEPDSGLYRTGDRGRWLEDGNIEFRGRKDYQVKIRGYRIELGEIERVLQSMPEVSQAAVLAIKGRTGDQRLAAYVIPVGVFDRELIGRCLSEQLPEHMLPSILIALERMPLTENGKVDRKKLAETDTEELAHDDGMDPRTEIEAKLAAIWRSLLGVDRIGIRDDFFKSGGHSLLAIRVISAIRKELETEVSIGDLFDYPTIELLAARMAVLPGGTSLPRITVGDRPERIPLSFSQERLWFIDQFTGSVAYHIPTVLHLHGKLDEKGLLYAFRGIVDRHEVLRTVIEQEDGMPWQRILEKNRWELGGIEGTIFKERRQLQEKIAQLIVKPFDLSNDHKLRADLIHLGEEEHILVVTLHHIASDGWSNRIMVKEFAELYDSFITGSSARLEPLPIQYADYAIWQRKYVEGKMLEKKLSYWKEKLGGYIPLDLPTDYQRPALQSTRGAEIELVLDKDLTEGILALSQQEGCTLYMTLLAAFMVLLSKYSGHEDIVVGSPVAGRTQHETDGLIGFFVNTLVLRADLGDDPVFSVLLQQIKGMTLDAIANQEVPFERVVDALVKERDLSRSPLFQVMFELQNNERNGSGTETELGGLKIEGEKSVRTTSKFDMSLLIAEQKEELVVNIEYCTDLFREDSIRRIGACFEALLWSIVKDPVARIGSLQMLSLEDETQLLVSFNDTSVDFPRDRTILDLFEEQAAMTPDKIAVVDDFEQISYKELDERSNQLGNYLRNRGVREESLVPICMERSVGMVMGILGIMKAGGAYVPIDPDYPVDRISFVLRDTAGKIMVSSSNCEKTLMESEAGEVIWLDRHSEKINSESKEKAERRLKPHHLAHVIYTSGTTGRPKGVLIEHRNLVNLLVNMSKRVEFACSCSFLSVTTFCFDIFYLELYLPIITGGKSILVNKDTVKDGSRLAAKLSHHNPTHMQATPTGWKLLLESGWNNREGIRMLTAGEPVGDELNNALTKIGKVWNLYGPTETTIYSTCKELKIGEKVSIGRPMENTNIYISGPKGELLPAGAVGEIYIGGAGVARGYLNHPELTAEKFIENQFDQRSGSKLYRTGDMGRWSNEGNIEYLGRKDDQVKIRGYRIELGEVERVLMESKMVKQAVVLARENDQGHGMLTAYVIPEGEYDKEGINAYLSRKLPGFMLPSSLVELESLPVTSNGKIDKKALPDPYAAGQLVNVYMPPRTEIEKGLVEIWKKILCVEKVGVSDNFYELGGHSLSAMRIASAIQKEFNMEIPVKIVLQFITIELLAKYIQMDVDNAVEESQTYETRML